MSEHTDRIDDEDMDHYEKAVTYLSIADIYAGNAGGTDEQVAYWTAKENGMLQRAAIHAQLATVAPKQLTKFEALIKGMSSDEVTEAAQSVPVEWFTEKE